MRLLLSSLFVAVLGASSIGCMVESHSHRRAPPGESTQPPSDAGPTSPPPRMPIDTGRTLHVDAGGGAGVFVTYEAGGNWKIFWTCDTKVSRNHTCNFQVAVGSHRLHEVSASPADAIVQQDAESFSAATRTTLSIDSVSFRTDPGAPIALTMRIDGQVRPDLIWFVSNGELSTAPTDPLELVPNEP